MDGEYWYKYIKEHKPDVLGKDIIDYVEQLKLDKEALEKQLILSGVVGSAKTQDTDDDKGWIYCPNCGRVKEDS